MTKTIVFTIVMVKPNNNNNNKLNLKTYQTIKINNPIEATVYQMLKKNSLTATTYAQESTTCTKVFLLTQPSSRFPVPAQELDWTQLHL